MERIYPRESYPCDYPDEMITSHQYSYDPEYWEKSHRQATLERERRETRGER